MSSWKQEIFDPLLDKRCCKRTDQLPVWKAKWIWYPGQLAAAMHGHSVRKTVERCCNVGYPGLWPHPQTFLYARRTATIKRPLKIRWMGPRGRTVLLIDTAFDYAGLGHYVENYTCITQREKILPAGRIELEVIVDYSDGLACFMLEGGPFSTGENWEVSLDRKEWVQAECEPVISTPGRTPDNPQMTVVTLSHPRILQAKNVKQKGSSYVFGKGGELLVDFGYNTMGQVGWRWSGSGKGAVRVCVGESSEEARDIRPANAEQRPMAPVRQDESALNVRLPERALRYAFLKAEQPAQILSLKTESTLWPVEYRGDFESSDMLLNTIWKAGAATLHAVMRDYFFLDAIKRDALPWAPGDYLCCIGGADLVFFDRNVVRQHLLATCLPGDPRPLDLGLGSAGLSLPTAIYHDYMVSGDASFATRHKDKIVNSLKFYESHTDRHGFVCFGAKPITMPDWTAADMDMSMILTWLQMELMRTWEIGAEFHKLWKDEKGVRHYAALAKKLRCEIRRSLWDQKKGMFIDGLKKGKRVRKFSRFAQIRAILFDLVSKQEAARLAEQIVEGEFYPPPSYSINQYWEMLACIKAGKCERVLDILRSVYGAMLDLGPGTFWEDFIPGEAGRERLAFYGRPYGKSLCHGYAGGIAVAVLSGGLLGIQAESPGYGKVVISPRLCGLEWIRGKVPTPHGPIGLELNAGGHAKVELPSGLQARVVTSDSKTIVRLKGPSTSRFDFDPSSCGGWKRRLKQ